MVLLLKVLIGAVVGIGTVLAINSVTSQPKEEEKPTPTEDNNPEGGRFSLSNTPLTETDKFILSNCKDTNFLNSYFSKKGNNLNNGNNNLMGKIATVQKVVSTVKGIMDLTVTAGVDIAKLFNYKDQIQQQQKPPQPQQTYYNPATKWQPDEDGVIIIR